jgi:hypothetical protein
MIISKLTYTLKGEVLPKWLFDEYAHVAIRQALKDVGKILHHFVPLSRESLLKQQIDRIVYSIVFLFFCHGGFLGHARVIFFKRDKIETQISILGPCPGLALKKNDHEQPALIPLIQIIFGMK